MFTVGSNCLAFPHLASSTWLLFSVGTHKTCAHNNSITKENNFSVINSIYKLMGLKPWG